MSVEAGIGVMATKLGMMSFFEPNGKVVPVTAADIAKPKNGDMLDLQHAAAFLPLTLAPHQDLRHRRWQRGMAIAQTILTQDLADELVLVDAKPEKLLAASKMLPYLNMFIFSNTGGVVADHLVTKRILSVTRTRKLLNTIGFIVASLALMAIPIFRTFGGAVL